MVICSSNDGDLLQNSKPHVRCDDDLLRAISFRAGLGSEIDVVMAFLYLDDCALIRLESMYCNNERNEGTQFYVHHDR